MNPLLRLLMVAVFGVFGGMLVWTAGSWLDVQLHPECELIRFAGVVLFGTFVLVFGVLGVVWPVSDQGDPFLTR